MRNLKKLGDWARRLKNLQNIFIFQENLPEDELYTKPKRKNSKETQLLNARIEENIFPFS